MSGPTPRQRECWEAVVRTGSQSAAAAELGCHPGSVASGMRGYMAHTGEPWPANVRRYAASGESQAVELAEAFRRAEDAERRAGAMATELLERRAEVAALRAQLDDWPAVIEAKLDQLLARPLGGFVADHRRIADGGSHPRHQRRQAAGR